MTASSPRYFQWPLSENVNDYCPGGLHPVPIGDQLSNGRYEVVNKLGCGGYATIWLVKDTTDGSFAALKILTARAGNTEVNVHKHLLAQPDTPGREHVLLARNWFEHVGPHGTHQCIVTDVLGSSIIDVDHYLSDVYDRIGFPPHVAQSISLQIAKGLEFLHRAGVVHGDLTMRNILLWSPDCPIKEYILEPRGQPMLLAETREPPATLPPNVPSRVLYRCLSEDYDKRILSGSPVRVKIIDFGESFITQQPLQRQLHIPVQYQSPESMFKLPVGKPVDIWAFAVIIHDLISEGSPLFASFRENDADMVIAGMVLRLKAKLPAPLWDAWEARARFFDDNGEWISDKQKPTRWDGWIIADTITNEACGDVAAFTEMMKGMVEIEPVRRATISEVVKRMRELWAR